MRMFPIAIISATLLATTVYAQQPRTPGPDPDARGRIPTPVLPGTLSSDCPKRGIHGRQRVRRPSPCPERGTRMEPWVAPRGVPTPIASLPAPQAACRSPISALIRTGLAPAHPGAFLSRTTSAVAGGLTTLVAYRAPTPNKVIRSNPLSSRFETQSSNKRFRLDRNLTQVG